MGTGYGAELKSPKRMGCFVAECCKRKLNLKDQVGSTQWLTYATQRGFTRDECSTSSLYQKRFFGIFVQVKR